MVDGTYAGRILRSSCAFGLEFEFIVIWCVRFQVLGDVAGGGYCVVCIGYTVDGAVLDE
jgi:hypothetical protein